MKVNLRYIFVLFVFILSVNSEEWKCGDDCTATLENGVMTITGSGKMKDYLSYSYIPWYDSRKSIKSVVIEGITTIGKYAFRGCSSLTSITIPNSVTAIGDSAFEGCSLTSITIPNSVTTIGEAAFSECSSLTSITIPNSVTTIGNKAFAGCSSLTSGSIGSIKWELNKETREMSFTGEGKMMDFANSGAAPWYASAGYIKKVTISEGITTIGGYAFSYCSLTSVTIPNSVTTIGDCAFFRCSSLTSITIPNSVTTIGDRAFFYCYKLTSIAIPKNVKEIGQSVFAGCPNLSTITVAEGNEYFKSVDNVLFTKDGMKLIRYAPAKTETSYTVPNGVVVIADSAFYGCSHLESITLPSSVTTIGECTFYECSSLTLITIPNSVTKIGFLAFSWCSSLTSGSIGSIKWELNKDTKEMSFTGEGKMMDFEYSSARPWDASTNSIKKVTISEGITTIGEYAFYECSSLTSVNNHE